MEVSEVSQGVADLSLLSPQPVAGSSKEAADASGADWDSEGDEAFKDDPIPYVGQIPLTKEHKNTLFEILRCAVCLEIPKSRPNLQVKSCENGHHFCTFCHQQLKSCAICRGRLFSGRNFVVEELITKMGKSFGILRHLPMKTYPPLPVPRGKFQCPHCVDEMKLSAKGMLLHIRNLHKDDLMDKLRTNPYTGWFYGNVNLGPGKRRVCSFQVSDFGLMTLVVVATEETTQAWVQILGKVQSNVTYRLNVTSKERQTRGVTDVNILPFSTTNSTDKLPDYCTFSLVTDINEKIDVCFVVQRAESSQVPQGWPFFSFESAYHPSDRASRRARARNRRRTKTRHKKIAALEKATGGSRVTKNATEIVL